MLEAQYDADDLFRRIRDRFKTDEDCYVCIRDIIMMKLKVWPLPSLSEVQQLS